MKLARKLVTLAIVLAMVMAFMVPTAMAAEIDVKNVLDGETYTAYKILNYTNSGNAYSYYLSADEYDAIGSVLEAAGFKFTQSADRTQFFVDNTTDFDVEKAASAAASLATANLGEALGKYTATGANGSVIFNDLTTGYYFVTSSAGTLCALHSDTEIATAVEKNTSVTVAKAVEDTEAQIGDTVNYTVTVTDGRGTNKAITVTDTMHTALTFKEDTLKVTVGNDEKEKGENKDYTVSVEDNVITVVIAAKVVEAVRENETIVITYSADVNEGNAVEGKYTNSVVARYSQQTTAEAKTEVSSYNLTVNKFDDNQNPLTGAKFELYRDNETTALTLVDITDQITNRVATTRYYRIAVANESTAKTIDMTAGTYSSAVIYGLDGDSTYMLVETAAPAGYNLLPAAVTKAMENANQTVDVVNQAGAVLPTTGGIGTTIFYVLGGVLFLGALVILFTNKRMRQN